MTHDEAVAARAKIQEALDYLWSVLGIPECLQVAAKLKEDAERAADALAKDAVPDSPTYMAFDAHLDTCHQCLDDPLSLCPEGKALLAACVAATAKDDPVKP